MKCVQVLNQERLLVAKLSAEHYSCILVDKSPETKKKQKKLKKIKAYTLKAMDDKA